jgi:transposase
VLRNWLRDQKADPNEAFLGKGAIKPAQAELDRPRKENAKLKLDRDIPKPQSI